jgi:arylsulfatase A-like enzyme
MTTISRRHLLFGAPAFVPQRPRHPNVLWIMTDEHRPDSLGCYGSKWGYSPNLDRLAESGALFESAYTPAPVCVPARSSLLTGNYGSTTGVLHNNAKLSSEARFLTWEFERAGYQTASFGKKHYFHSGRQAFETERGEATDRVVEPEAYGKPYNAAAYDAVQYPNAPTERLRRRWILAGKFPAPISETAEEQNVQLSMDWLEKRDPAKPFLLRLSLNAPHTPVVVPEQFLRRIDVNRIDLPVADDRDLAGAPARVRVLLRDFQGSQRLTPAELKKARHYYYARVAFADYEIGRLLDWMRSRRLLDDTIITMTADHGTDLGDHGLLQKQTFYEQVATVPYLFAAPSMSRKGLRFRTPVNTITLLPTLMRLAGLPGANTEAGELSESLIRGGEPQQQPVFSELQFGYQKYRDDERQVMGRDRSFKLSLFINSQDPDGELYNLRQDPLERNNLFWRAEHAATAARLKSYVLDWDRKRQVSGPHS